MKKKYGKDDSFTMQEWCELNLLFYQDLFMKEGVEYTIEELIERYHRDKGLVLDKEFVVQMLESLPAACASQINGKWTLSISAISSYAQN